VSGVVADVCLDGAAEPLGVVGGARDGGPVRRDQRVHGRGHDVHEDGLLGRDGLGYSGQESM
jgi:hypothetical protein